MSSPQLSSFSRHRNHSFASSLLLFVFFVGALAAADTIRPNQSLLDGQTLISSGGHFELGFFSPPGSQNRYFGIWYHSIPDHTIVWVANRDNPLRSSNGALNLTADGNLVLQDRNGNMVWSTNTSSTASHTVMQLLDTGNLIVSGGQNNIVWQSFDHPTDSMVPGMKISWNLRTNVERHLTSWKSDSDPSTGAYTYKMDRYGARQMFMWEGTTRIFRDGPWNTNVFTDNTSAGLMNLILITNKNETYYTYDTGNSSILTRFVISHTGQAQRLVWVNGGWSVFWKFPMDECDDYAKCGAYGICDPSTMPLCSCLKGFEPRSPKLWNLRISSDGCFRSTALSCGSVDGFLEKPGMKLPDTSNATMVEGMSFNACREMCIRNCSCTAFAMMGDGSACFTWAGDLVDLRVASAGGGDLYVRLAASDLENPDVITNEGYHTKRSPVLIIKIAVPLGILFFGVLVWLYLKQLRKGGSSVQHLLALGSSGNAAKDKLKYYDLPLFPFCAIAKSTNNFSDENKLGQGGFGTVYKGQLQNGTEIAVKRLSRSSGQGIEEFANEIRLIVKLQHKNLVRLLGCSIGGDERLLIYEYMPNKSLDHFLFGPEEAKPLDWEDRKRIILGVTQGLVYLHKYSRLKIIHRDLKSSNILLDSDMNPKISDFGIARIFSGNQDQEKTNFVIGTYGYMPPEYAAQGLFSEKSDVFSFGVLLLEIVSGRKNGSFVCGDETWNLLRHAWECWKTGQLTELMDPVLRASCPLHELTFYVHVALLCVQESAAHRPTMSFVQSMLSCETEVLPIPEKIAFLTVRSSRCPNTPSNGNLDCSHSNELTITAIDPR